MATDLWERVKSATSDIVTSASEKTREGLAVASRKLDISSIKRDIHREFAGLGGRVHQVLTAEPPGDVAADVTVLNHLARIRDLEERLETKEQELRDIRESGASEPVSATVVATTASTTPPSPVSAEAGDARPDPVSGEGETALADEDLPEDSNSEGTDERGNQ